MVMELGSVVRRLESLYDTIELMQYERIDQERDVRLAREAKSEKVRLYENRKAREKIESERKLNLARERSKQESRRREYQLQQQVKPQQEKLSFFGWIRKHLGGYGIDEKLESIEPTIRWAGATTTPHLGGTSLVDQTIGELYGSEGILDNLIEVVPEQPDIYEVTTGQIAQEGTTVVQEMGEDLELTDILKNQQDPDEGIFYVDWGISHEIFESTDEFK